MKIKLLTCALLATLLSCNEKKDTKEVSATPSLTGTWKLVSGKVITKGDTVSTFPVPNQEMIKIFNEDTFAFFKHDTNGAKGDSAVFDAGSGSYTLKEDDYSEHLEYCNYRGWENRDFKFKLRMHGDTIIQTGIEKIDSLNINQEIVEVYVRKK
jgi:hypothetical protein